VLVLQKVEARTLMTFGAAALAAGVGLTVWTLPSHSLVLFFLGTIIAGMGFGTGFQGAVRTIVPFAQPHERAGVLSIVFIVSYLALGAPAVAAGARLAQHGDIFGTAREFGTVVMALAMVALLGTTLLSAVRQRLASAIQPAC
jgi:sugar phosphate permease